MKAINIQWDTDENIEIFSELPAEIKIPSDVTDEKISDYISDVTGFCHFGFELTE